MQDLIVYQQVNIMIIIQVRQQQQHVTQEYVTDIP